jgi:hypothetical protein
MDSGKPQHVWILQRTPDSIRLAVIGDEAAKVFQEAGWRTTRLPRAAFSPEELRCLDPLRRHRSD